MYSLGTTTYWDIIKMKVGWDCPWQWLYVPQVVLLFPSTRAFICVLGPLFSWSYAANCFSPSVPIDNMSWQTLQNCHIVHEEKVNMTISQMLHSWGKTPTPGRLKKLSKLMHKIENINELEKASRNAKSLAN